MHRFVFLALIALAVSGCGGGAKPTFVNTLRGTYRGVGIGDTTAAVQRIFGHEVLSGHAESIAPRKDDFVDIGGPTVVAGGCGTALRYAHVTFFVCGGHVNGFIVAQRGARTERGVAIGDDADRARARYPRLTCGQAPFEGGSYPYCGGRIAKHRWLWFGRNPVRSITVAAVPLRTQSSRVGARRSSLATSLRNCFEQARNRAWPSLDSSLAGDGRSRGRTWSPGRSSRSPLIARTIHNSNNA